MPTDLVKISGLVFLLFPAWGLLIPLLFPSQKNKLGRTMADAFYLTFVLEWAAFVFLSLLFAGGQQLSIGEWAAQAWKAIGFYYVIFTLPVLGVMLGLYVRYYYPEDELEPFILAFWSAIIPGLALVVIVIFTGIMSVFNGFI